MKLIIASVLAIIGLSYGAYIENQNYEKYGDPSKYTPERSKHINQEVRSSLIERQECIERDPNDLCNRDLSIQQLAAFHGELYDKYNITDGPRQARNRYLLFAGIAAIVLFFSSKSLRRKGGKH